MSIEACLYDHPKHDFLAKEYAGSFFRASGYLLGSQSSSCAGTASSGTKASVVHVSKGEAKIREYLKGINRPSEVCTTHKHDAVLIRKAEYNMQRYTEFTRAQQLRKVENKEIFAVCVSAGWICG
jgi:hypothetical protein